MQWVKWTHDALFFTKVISCFGVIANLQRGQRPNFKARIDHNWSLYLKNDGFGCLRFGIGFWQMKSEFIGIICSFCGTLPFSFNSCFVGVIVQPLPTVTSWLIFVSSADNISIHLSTLNIHTTIKTILNIRNIQIGEWTPRKGDQVWQRTWRSYEFKW